MKLLAVGSINKRYSLLMSKIDKFGWTDQFIVCTGTLGIREDRDIIGLTELDEFLVKHRCQLYSIRGVADAPEYFDGTVTLRAISLIKDFHVEQKILFVGGGVPPDRKLIGKPPYSLPLFDSHSLDFLSELRNKVEVVVTHQPPSLVNFRMTNALRFWSERDKELLPNTKAFQDKLGHIANIVTPAHWYYSGEKWETQEVNGIKFNSLNDGGTDGINI